MGMSPICTNFEASAETEDIVISPILKKAKKASRNIPLYIMLSYDLIMPFDKSPNMLLRICLVIGSLQSLVVLVFVGGARPGHLVIFIWTKVWDKK